MSSIGQKYNRIAITLEKAAKLAGEYGLTAQVMEPFVILNSTSAFATLRVTDKKLTLEGLMVNLKDTNTGLGSVFLDHILAIADHLLLSICVDIGLHSRVFYEEDPGKLHLLSWYVERGFTQQATLLTRPAQSPTGGNVLEVREC